jgi:hypothetical protein
MTSDAFRLPFLVSTLTLLTDFVLPSGHTRNKQLQYSQLSARDLFQVFVFVAGLCATLNLHLDVLFFAADD